MQTFYYERDIIIAQVIDNRMNQQESLIYVFFKSSWTLPVRHLPIFVLWMMCWVQHLSASCLPSEQSLDN